jgi:hypothetical protein
MRRSLLPRAVHSSFQNEKARETVPFSPNTKELFPQPTAPVIFLLGQPRTSRPKGDWGCLKYVSDKKGKGYTGGRTQVVEHLPCKHEAEFKLQ